MGINFEGAVQQCAQDLERFDIFWKIFIEIRLEEAGFPLITLHGFRIGENNWNRVEA